MCRALMIAGIGSGCGKTTVTSAVIQGFVDKGFKVQPFKVGPDYIDPQHHSRLAGRACRNLDCWMMGEDGVIRNFLKGCAGADIAIIEGVGGIYDGLGTGEFASSAYVAKVLDVPVVLVVDTWGISRTAAALIRGIANFDSINLAGVIFNFVGSEGHYKLLKDVVKHNLPNIKVLGGILRSKKGFVPERHLGIIQASEIDWEERREILRDIASQIDLDGLWEVAKEVDVTSIEEVPFEKLPVRVAIANDEIFSFLYTENREMLKRISEEVLYFSPLNGETIPPGTQVLFLPGGYPELKAEKLMENRKFKEDIVNFVDSGLPVYAECGGLMYLSRKIMYQGKSYPMAGVIPVDISFGSRPILGYAEGIAKRAHPFLREGEKIRGHVFHYSVADVQGHVEYAYTLHVPTKGLYVDEGFVIRNTLVSYLHINWFSPYVITFLRGFLERAL
ncbi:cobyrinate a,c-diamide synthase [Thermosulfidibacter takaii]|nr:cobyrinate a,c-diamide synthase [Thermosulfidibacter takaii]